MTADQEPAVDLQAIVGSVPVGTQPTSLALSADGSALFVANAGSQTLTVVNNPPEFDCAEFNKFVAPLGIRLANGYGDLKGKTFRIAHMGHVNAPMILGTLGVIEVALNALGVPHGKGGTEAAIGYLGESVGA